jgi:hypothetical protein
MTGMMTEPTGGTFKFCSWQRLEVLLRLVKEIMEHEGLTSFTLDERGVQYCVYVKDRPTAHSPGA